MTKHMLKILLVLVMVLVSTSMCFAVTTKVININATVPSQNTMTVTLSKVVGTTWTAATAADFGILTLDPVNNVYGAGAYYAADVGVSSNATAWTVTHTRGSIVNNSVTPAQNLDASINVTFMKETGATSTQLSKVTFVNSNNVAYTNTQLAGGWLRVYYGIATGDPANDAAGALPITLTKAPGAYAGTATITLTP